MTANKMTKEQVLARVCKQSAGDPAMMQLIRQVVSLKTDPDEAEMDLARLDNMARNQFLAAVRHAKLDEALMVPVFEKMLTMGLEMRRAMRLVFMGGLCAAGRWDEDWAFLMNQSGFWKRMEREYRVSIGELPEDERGNE